MGDTNKDKKKYDSKSSTAASTVPLTKIKVLVKHYKKQQ